MAFITRNVERLQGYETVVHIWEMAFLRVPAPAPCCRLEGT